MECFINYFLKSLNYLEELRTLTYEVAGNWAEKREIVTNVISDMENRLKAYHPFTLVVGFLILFILVKYFFKKLKNLWRAISKKNYIYQNRFP